MAATYIEAIAELAAGLRAAGVVHYKGSVYYQGTDGLTRHSQDVEIAIGEAPRNLEAAHAKTDAPPRDAMFDDEVFEDILRGGPKLPAEVKVEQAPAPDGEPSP